MKYVIDRLGRDAFLAEVEKEHGPTATFASLGTDVNAKRERDVIIMMLRYPDYIGLARAGDIVACHFSNPSLARIRTAMVEAFGEFGTPQWISSVIERAGEELRPLVSELAMVDIPVRRVTIPKPKVENEAAAAERIAEEEKRTHHNIEIYAIDVATALIEADLIRQRGELHSILQRTPEGAPELADLQQRLSELELRRRALRRE